MEDVDQLIQETKRQISETEQKKKDHRDALAEDARKLFEELKEGIRDPQSTLQRLEVIFGEFKAIKSEIGMTEEVWRAYRICRESQFIWAQKELAKGEINISDVVAVCGHAELEIRLGRKFGDLLHGQYVRDGRKAVAILRVIDGNGEVTEEDMRFVSDAFPLEVRGQVNRKNPRLLTFDELGITKRESKRFKLLQHLCNGYEWFYRAVCVASKSNDYEKCAQLYAGLERLVTEQVKIDPLPHQFRMYQKERCDELVMEARKNNLKKSAEYLNTQAMGLDLDWIYQRFAENFPLCGFSYQDLGFADEAAFKRIKKTLYVREAARLAKIGRENWLQGSLDNAKKMLEIAEAIDVGST